MKRQTVTVWGRKEEREPLMGDIKGASISSVGTDSIDTVQPVVEIKFDPLFVSIEDIFRAISQPEKNELGGIANGVGKRIRI